jgi:hypothetical protein
MTSSPVTAANDSQRSARAFGKRKLAVMAVSAERSWFRFKPMPRAAPRARRKFWPLRSWRKR